MPRRTSREVETGDPLIRRALSILLEAKMDAKLWLDFEAEFSDNHDVKELDAAQWVSNWLVKNRSTVEYKDIDRLRKGLKGEGNEKPISHTTH